MENILQTVSPIPPKFVLEITEPSRTPTKRLETTQLSSTEHNEIISTYAWQGVILDGILDGLPVVVQVYELIESYEQITLHF